VSPRGTCGFDSHLAFAQDRDPLARIPVRAEIPEGVRFAAAAVASITLVGEGALNAPLHSARRGEHA